MHLAFTRRLGIALLATTAFIFNGCDRHSITSTAPKMTSLPPRIQQVFDKSKTVCFGRFMIDVPASTVVVWGGTDVPLGVNVYPNGAAEVKALAQKFIDELKSEKAIYQNNISLLVSVRDVVQPEGKIVVGYEGFQAIDEFKINGYFKLNNDGVVVDSRPLRDRVEPVVANITGIARRLRQRAETEIPTEPGNCIEHAFLPDEPDPHKETPAELIRIGFRLKEFPDTHLPILFTPSNPYYSESDSLEWRIDRHEKKQKAEDPTNPLVNTKMLRRGPRQIHDWLNGFEALSRTPEMPEMHSFHDFAMDFRGVPSDPLKPYAEIQMQTGVDGNTIGATKASLTDEEAIAVWDKITSSIRVRPTAPAPLKSHASSDSHLGDLAATGRVCPQTGWWEPEGGRRQHIKAGERMPHLITNGEPSLWQKLTGEKPSYRVATMWKLVSYDDMPAQAPDTSPDKKI